MVISPVALPVSQPSALLQLNFRMSDAIGSVTRRTNRCGDPNS